MPKIMHMDKNYSYGDEFNKHFKVYEIPPILCTQGNTTLVISGLDQNNLIGLMVVKATVSYSYENLTNITVRNDYKISVTTSHNQNVGLTVVGIYN